MPPTFTSTNPATGQPLSTYPHATSQDVDRALTAATAAFTQTQSLPPRWQADLLDTIAAEILALGDPLLEMVESESALPRPRVTGERGRTVGQLKSFATLTREGSWVDAVIETADPARTPAPKPDLRRMLIPRGPVAVFGASNFPLAFGAIGGDTASALAAGCSVVVKGHPSHPGTSQLVATAVQSALQKLNLPPGLFSLLQGTSHDLSNSLVTHPSITAVGFTGSQRAGRALFNLAAARPNPIPVFAEMGSVNPIVLTLHSLKDRTPDLAKGLASSILMGVGQFCTKPGIILAITDNPQPLLSALSSSLTTPGTMLNQSLRNTFCSSTTALSQTPGVTTVVAGASKDHAGITPSLFSTTASTFLSTPHLHEESFGPAALIVHCPTPQSAIDCLTQIQGSLTGTLHTSPSDDPATTQQLFTALTSISGRVILNGYPTGVEVSPAMVHSGPYPATTDPNSTSVGTASIKRFVRLISFQDTPDSLLPPALQNSNPLHLLRTINGQPTTNPVKA